MVGSKIPDRTLNLWVDAHGILISLAYQQAPVGNRQGRRPSRTGSAVSSHRNPIQYKNLPVFFSGRNKRRDHAGVAKVMTEQLDDLRRRTGAALDRLQRIHDEQDVGTAHSLLQELRDACEYERLIALAEALLRIDPKHERTRRLYAQALIETGKAIAAIDMLQTLAKRLPADHPESLEAMGLLGRAYKQIFFDSRDRASPAARQALKQAVAAYRKPYEANPANTWHGANLLALIANCRRLGIPLTAGLDQRELATRLLATLREIPPHE